MRIIFWRRLGIRARKVLTMIQMPHKALVQHRKKNLTYKLINNINHVFIQDISWY